jgi:hypothetical protein
MVFYDGVAFDGGSIEAKLNKLGISSETPGGKINWDGIDDLEVATRAVVNAQRSASLEKRVNDNLKTKFTSTAAETEFVADMEHLLNELDSAGTNLLSDRQENDWASAKSSSGTDEAKWANSTLASEFYVSGQALSTYLQGLGFHIENQTAVEDAARVTIEDEDELPLANNSFNNPFKWTQLLKYGVPVLQRISAAQVGACELADIKLLQYGKDDMPKIAAACNTGVWPNEITAKHGDEAKLKKIRTFTRHTYWGDGPLQFTVQDMNAAIQAADSTNPIEITDAPTTSHTRLLGAMFMLCAPPSRALFTRLVEGCATSFAANKYVRADKPTVSNAYKYFFGSE